MNLRELYKEKGIKNINTTVLDKRENSMKEILENDELEYGEWELLVNWLMGIKTEDEETENVLIKLEDIFCEQDESFSKENEGEMHILVGELIYRYCQETEEKRFPLMILCGYNIGYQIKSKQLYRGFVCLLNEWRLDMRRDESQEEVIQLPDVEEIREIVEMKQEAAENNKLEWQADQEDWNEMLRGLEICEKAIGSLIKINKQYKKELEIQREESDILWWMLNEWSDIYEQSFRALKREQLALAAPIELQEIIPYDLGPFAVRQVLCKVMSLNQNGNKKMRLSQLVSAANEILLNYMNSDRWNSSKVQPVFLALRCRAKAGEEGWRGLFGRECTINPDEVEMSLEEFSYQFYLELELAAL